MEHLHVLNGDSTAVSFGGTGLPGRRAVWREALCEGRVAWHADPLAVLRERSSFFPDYEHQVLAEWEVIAAHRGPVVLWFEFDLFCQINLLFLVSYLPDENPVFLICPGDHPEIPNFHGLGECNARQLAALYVTRIHLTEADRQAARLLWKAYTSPDPEALAAVRDTGPFVHFPAAISLHLQRFPSVTTGLNRIETFFLEQLLRKPAGLSTLLPAFWRAYPGFGFGDTQLKDILNDLVRYGLLTDNGVDYSLTPDGHAVWTGSSDYVSRWTGSRWLGGCELAPGQPVPRWNPAEKTISRPPLQ